MAVAFTYWSWEAAVSAEICDKILADAAEQPFSDGVVGAERKVNRTIRDNMIAWMPRLHISECILFSYAMQANQSADWHLDASMVVDQVQISRYREGQFYSVHNDLTIYDDAPMFERKMSAVLQLTDPAEYKGGELEVGNSIVKEQAKGSVIVFPSYIHHQVKPVTEGVRHSAICWIAGARLK